MPKDERPLRKTERPKNYESPFDALERDPQYIGAVFLTREYGAQEPHTIELLQILGFEPLRAEGIAQRARFVSGTRDAYHEHMRVAFNTLPGTTQQELREVVDLFMRTEAAHKYWQHEPQSKTLAYTLISQNASLPVVSYALTQHLGGTVKASTIREVLKFRGRDGLLSILRAGVEDRIAATDATLVTETYTALEKQAARERKQYKSTFNKEPRNRAFMLTLRAAGISPEGIARLIRKRLRIQVPAVSIKYFLNTNPPFPALSDLDTAWLEKHTKDATTDFLETKQKHYQRGAQRRIERSLVGEALTRFQDARVRKFQEEETQLYREYAPLLRRIVARFDAVHTDDVVQESFTRLFTQLRSEKLELWSNISPLSLLATIAKNIVRDRQSRAIVKNTVSDDTAIETAAYTGKAQDEIVDENRHALAIHAALLQIPDEQRVIVRLKFFNGMSTSEIANILNLPLGTVKSRWRLAAEKLKTQLAHMQIDEE
jgi:RNA polymerase sigma-70 factor (ECF subfamily)